MNRRRTQKRSRKAHHKHSPPETGEFQPLDDLNNEKEKAGRPAHEGPDAVRAAIAWDRDPRALEIAARTFAGGARSTVGVDLMPSEMELARVRGRLVEILDFLRLVAREADAARRDGKLHPIPLAQAQSFQIDPYGRFERRRGGADQIDFIWQEIMRGLQGRDVRRLRECERCRHLFLAVQERSRFCARRCANAAHQSKYVKRISGPKGQGL